MYRYLTSFGNIVWQNREQDVLPIVTAEETVHRVATQRCLIFVRFQRAIAVVDLDLVGFDEEVAGYIRPGNFAAVGAVAKMASRLGKQVIVGDCHCYTAAETRPGQRVGELRDVMLVRISSR